MLPGLFLIPLIALLAASVVTAPVVTASVVTPSGAPARPGVAAIVQRSVEANRVDWKANPEYDYFERDGTGGNTKTYQVLMILGSPYRRLVKVNGKPLSPEDNRKQQKELDAAIAQRRAESPAARARRVADFQKGRARDHLMMEQLTQAFDFRYAGEGTMSGHRVYILEATPRTGYRPPNRDSEVLTGMRGKLWIDQATFQWVKVTAQVIRPVSIEGFLAQVEPGTFFELEKMPVAEGVWLPKHFAMKSHSRILDLFTHRTAEDETYFDYRKSNPALNAGF